MVYLLKMVIFHGELLVITRGYQQNGVLTRLVFFDSSFQFETTALCVTLLGLVGHMTSTPQGVMFNRMVPNHSSFVSKSPTNI